MRLRGFSRGMKQVIGLCLAVFFVQVFAGAITHVALVEHAFCEVHLAVEHGEGHRAEADGAEQHATVSVPDHPEHEESADEDCHHLMWLDGPQVTTPDAVAGLLDLPPPPHAAVRTPAACRQPAPHPIALRHLSPGLSPPDHLALV